MAMYDIYIGTENQVATAHGAEYVSYGVNPAHALCMLTNNKKIMDEICKEHPDVTELFAFDADMSASIFIGKYGTYELHVYGYGTETVMTIVNFKVQDQ